MGCSSSKPEAPAANTVPPKPPVRSVVSTQPPSPNCVVCESNGDGGIPVAAVCHGCNGTNRYLCTPHAVSHQQHSGFRPVLSISSSAAAVLLDSPGPALVGMSSEGPSAASVATAPVPPHTVQIYCKDHPGCPLDRYCVTDRTPVCESCCGEGGPHSGHSPIVLLSDALAEARAHADRAASEAIQRADAAAKEKQAMQLCFDASKTVFLDTIADLIQQLNALKTDLVTKAEAEVGGLSEALDAEEKAFRQCVVSLRQPTGQQPVDATLTTATALRNYEDICARFPPVVPPAVEICMRSSDAISAVKSFAWLSSSSGPNSASSGGPGTDGNDGVEPVRVECRVEGPGIVSYTPGAVNSFTLFCLDSDSQPIASLSPADIKLSLKPAVSSGEALAGDVSQSSSAPGVFFCAYYAPTEECTVVEVDVTVGGKSPVGFPLRVLSVASGVLMFPGSRVLAPPVSDTRSRDFGYKLRRWLCPTEDALPVLLYRMSEHGPALKNFHDRCDGVTSTLVLVKSGANVFGGYSGTAAWHSMEANIESHTAFLVTVINPHGIPPTRYHVAAGLEGNAMYGGPSLGPVFGSSACDLGLGVEGDLSSGQSRSSFPVEYVDKVPCKAGRTFTGASEFVCDEVEVWEIRLPVPELDEPTP